MSVILGQAQSKSASETYLENVRHLEPITGVPNPTGDGTFGTLRKVIEELARGNLSWIFRPLAPPFPLLPILILPMGELLFPFFLDPVFGSILLESLGRKLIKEISSKVCNEMVVGITLGSILACIFILIMLGRTYRGPEGKKSFRRLICYKGTLLYSVFLALTEYYNHSSHLTKLDIPYVVVTAAMWTVVSVVGIRKIQVREARMEISAFINLSAGTIGLAYYAFILGIPLQVIGTSIALAYIINVIIERFLTWPWVLKPEETPIQYLSSMT